LDDIGYQHFLNMTGESSSICQSSTFTKDNYIVPSHIMLSSYERMHIFPQ